MGKKNGRSWRMVRDSLKIWMEYTYLDDSLVEVVDRFKAKKDTTTYPDEKESEYPGGLKGWSHYLQKNLKYPERAQGAEISGDVDVEFIVDKNGVVLGPFVVRSVEYSLDEEALKVIKESGKWEPAFQNGRFVKSYKRQPIRFRMQ
jgi:protein TonB